MSALEDLETMPDCPECRLGGYVHLAQLGYLCTWCLHHWPCTKRRNETHCPKCDGTNLFVSSSVEAGFLCRECQYGFVDRRTC